MTKPHLTSHKVNPCNDKWVIRVDDEPGAGGANHVYVMYLPNDEFNEELNSGDVVGCGRTQVAIIPSRPLLLP